MTEPKMIDTKSRVRLLTTDGQKNILVAEVVWAKMLNAPGARRAGDPLGQRYGRFLLDNCPVSRAFQFGEIIEPDEIVDGLPTCCRSFMHASDAFKGPDPDPETADQAEDGVCREEGERVPGPRPRPMNADEGPAPADLTFVHDWIVDLRFEMMKLGIPSMLVLEKSPLGDGTFKWILQTEGKRYSIRARSSDLSGRRYSYIGAQGSIINGGGRDLADGRLTIETWRDIVTDIYDYEKGTGRFCDGGEAAS